MRILNVRPRGEVDVKQRVSSETHDILLRANEQGERLRKIEEPFIARTGNPFGDILEQRSDERLNHHV